MTHTQAIKQSTQQSETVYLDYSEALYDALLAECDDHTDVYLGQAREENQFWGADESDTDWRVHLTTPL